MLCHVLWRHKLRNSAGPDNAPDPTPDTQLPTVELAIRMANRPWLTACLVYAPFIKNC